MPDTGPLILLYRRLSLLILGTTGFWGFGGSIRCTSDATTPPSICLNPLTYTHCPRLKSPKSMGLPSGSVNSVIKCWSPKLRSTTYMICSAATNCALLPFTSVMRARTSKGSQSSKLKWVGKLNSARKSLGSNNIPMPTISTGQTVLQYLPIFKSNLSYLSF
jgi:hypothetical protein